MHIITKKTIYKSNIGDPLRRAVALYYIYDDFLLIFYRINIPATK